MAPATSRRSEPALPSHESPSQPHAEAAGDAAGDVRGLEQARLVPRGRGVDLYRALQRREREAHQDRGCAEQEQGQRQVEPQDRAGLVRGAEPEHVGAAPVLVQPREPGRRHRQPGEQDQRRGGEAERAALAEQEHAQRPAQPRGSPGADAAAERGAAQVDRQQRAEGERRGRGELPRAAGTREARATARKTPTLRRAPATGRAAAGRPARSPRQLPAAGARRGSPAPARGLRAPRRSRRHEHRRQHVRGRRGQRRAAHAEMAHEEPGASAAPLAAPSMLTA